jgi:hypothetical protein
MEYRQLGRAESGVNHWPRHESVWYRPAPQEEVNKIIDASLDLGINFIDAANTTSVAVVRKRGTCPQGASGALYPGHQGCLTHGRWAQ